MCFVLGGWIRVLLFMRVNFSSSKFACLKILYLIHGLKLLWWYYQPLAETQAIIVFWYQLNVAWVDGFEKVV